MSKRIIIVGNGKLSKQYLTLIQPQDYVIGVDRAAHWLIGEGRVPDIAIGDFDSVVKEEFRQIKRVINNIQQFPPDKDKSDMELAIRYAIKKKPTEVLILGGMGSRMDHTIATWYLLDALLAAKIPHVLLDETNRVRLIGHGKTVIERSSYRYISILPYTKSIMLSLTGFRYDLSKTTLIHGTTRGVSNEITGRQAGITLFSGKAWVIESND